MVYYLPVLIEPVVSLGLGIEGITEVAGARRRHPVHGTVIEKEAIRELLVAALVVILQDAEVAASHHYTNQINQSDSVFR